MCQGLYGGMNKTHESIESAACIADSFDYMARGLMEGDTSYIEGQRVLLRLVGSHYDNENSPKRVYFLCPSCGRSVRYLYDKRSWERIMCRHCARLNYLTQQVAHGKRAYELRLRREAEAVGMPGYLSPIGLIQAGFPPKPAWMSQRQYVRHEERYHRAADKLLTEYEKRFGAIGKMLNKRLGINDD